MKTRILAFTICLALSPILIWAQEKANLTHALKIELGLPITQSNPAFKDLTQGIGYTNINYQYRMLKNNKVSPIVGLGFSSSYIMVTNYKIIDINQGGLFSYGGMGKLGVEIKHDDEFIVDYHVKGGYLFMNSRNKQGAVNNETLNIRNFEHFFIEPGINFTYMISETSGFSFNVSYIFRDMKFKAHHLALSELPSFANANLNGISSHLNFGFGYTLYLNKGKKQKDF
jgi:outer membrane protein W